MPLRSISKNLIHAVLSAEDPNFFGHEGIDWDALKESIETNLEKGRYARGGSTITQQLAKNLFFSTHKSLIRKGREAIVASWMEHDLTKKRIIEIYLNVIEWGDGVYGCEAAARRYYGVSCAALDVDQAAGLAAMIPSPRRINPRTNQGLHARATRRVLRQMRWAGYLKRDIRDMGNEPDKIAPDESEPEPREQDDPAPALRTAPPVPHPDGRGFGRSRLPLVVNGPPRPFHDKHDRISSVSAPPEDADVETASADYAKRFDSPVGEWMLATQREITFDLLRDLEGASVLDVGGGHGQVAPALARRGHRVSVLASSPAAVAEALRPSVDSGRVGLLIGDLRNPPVEPRSFDVVLSYRLLAHARDLPGLVAGLTRSARVAVIVDYATTRSFNAIADSLFAAKKRVEGNTRPFLVLRDAEVEDLFRQNGFRRASETAAVLLAHGHPSGPRRPHRVPESGEDVPAAWGCAPGSVPR